MVDDLVAEVVDRLEEEEERGREEEEAERGRERWCCAAGGEKTKREGATGTRGERGVRLCVLMCGGDFCI